VCYVYLVLNFVFFRNPNPECTACLALRPPALAVTPTLPPAVTPTPTPAVAAVVSPVIPWVWIIWKRQ